MSLQVDLFYPLRDFDLEIKLKLDKGILGLTGPSGAGKSTLFSLINGLLKPAAGCITLGSRVLVDCDRGIFLPPHRRRIGTAFQDKRLFPHLTIKKNLLFGTAYPGSKRFTLEEVVDFLNLGPLLSSYPHQISGGEAQRAAMGRALLSSPELLLLDEPFNAIDLELREGILDVLRNVGDKVLILVISHDLSDLKRLTDRTIVINRGRTFKVIRGETVA